MNSARRTRVVVRTFLILAVATLIGCGDSSGGDGNGDGDGDSDAGMSTGGTSGL